jgi:hypothetical protein
MKKLVPAAAALLAAACAANAPSMDDAPATLAAAETAFAAHSVREDMKAAFLAAFAPDGVFVRGGWVVAAQSLPQRPAPPIVLEWRPQYVEVAASGELGLSTGPSKVTSRANPEAAPSYGQFVSIWRRAPGGPWKVEVDLGISHPEAALWKDALVARHVPPVATAPGEGLAAAEADFERIAAAQGLRAAYGARGAVDLRIYRSGFAPPADRAASLASPAFTQARLAWKVDRSETARSGDFGYTRGAYGEAANPTAPQGYFLRAWRREAAGWRVILDVAQPAPRPA